MAYPRGGLTHGPAVGRDRTGGTAALLVPRPSALRAAAHRARRLRATRTPRFWIVAAARAPILGVLAAYGEARGVDRAWAGVRRARAAGRQVGQATVTHLPFPDARFHLVTSFDVLYCLEEADERAAVSEMFRVLRPGGRVLINVAAMPILTGNHSVLAHEVRRYRASGLRALLERAGFSVERLTYTNTAMLPILVPLRLLQRGVGLAREEDDDATREMQVPPALLNMLLDRVLALEAAVVRHIDLPCGSSLLALARKPVPDAD